MQTLFSCPKILSERAYRANIYFLYFRKSKLIKAKDHGNRMLNKEPSENGRRLSTRQPNGAAATRNQTNSIFTTPINRGQDFPKLTFVIAAELQRRLADRRRSLKGGEWRGSGVHPVYGGVNCSASTHNKGWFLGSGNGKTRASKHMRGNGSRKLDIQSQLEGQ